MTHFPERNIFVVFLAIFLLVPDSKCGIPTAVHLSSRPLTQPSYIIPHYPSCFSTTLPFRFQPFAFFLGFVFPISPSSTRGYCLSKDVHKCFSDLNEISCMWTFTSVHAVSVSCVQTVTHSRKHSIRLDEHIQTGGAGDEERKKKRRPMHIPCILATL